MNDLCFLDLETTGFDPELDSIIEVSFVRYKAGVKVAELDEVCLPDKSPLSPVVSQITGIYQDELETKGQTFQDLIPIIQEKIGESVIVGHNIDFDINFLVKNGINLDQNGRLDTHDLARIILINEESYALEVLSRKYQLSHENAHRAMSDVLASKDLLALLLPRLNALPQAYFQTIKSVLEKSDWDAKSLFLEPQKVESEKQKSTKPKTQTPDLPSTQGHATISKTINFPDTLIPHQPQLLRLEKDDEIGAQLIGLTQKNTDKNFVITTSRTTFYPDLPRLYPPSEVLNPPQLHDFGALQTPLSHKALVFFLKITLRKHLGLIERDACDLFFSEYDWWKKVAHHDYHDDDYQSYLKGKLNQQTLVVSHDHWHTLLRYEAEIWRARDTNLLVDEGEDFVTSTLMSVNICHDLWPFLESKDTDLANQTHFFVTHFCKQVLEKTLEHQITPFPLKLALPSHRYDKLAEVCRTITPDPAIEAFASTLESPDTYDLRWAYYNPQNGHLSLNTWCKSDWENHLKTLTQFPTLMTYRHRLNEDELHFFTTFFSPHCQILHSPQDTNPPSRRKPIIPDDLMAATSPDYYEYCAQKIVETLHEKCPDRGWIGVSTSSQTIMRSIYELVAQKLQDQDDIAILGERLSGGRGKLTQILKNQTKPKGILFTQSLGDPILQTLDFKAFILQKFPFPFPHPIQQHLEQKMKHKNLSFWDLYTIPLVATKISRHRSHLKAEVPLIVIDPRENAAWAKKVWKHLE